MFIVPIFFRLSFGVSLVPLFNRRKTVEYAYVHGTFNLAELICLQCFCNSHGFTSALELVGITSRCHFTNLLTCTEHNTNDTRICTKGQW